MIERKPHIRSVILGGSIIIFCGLEWFLDITQIITDGFPPYSRFYTLFALTLILILFEGKIKISWFYLVTALFLVYSIISAKINESSIYNWLAFLPFILNPLFVFIVVKNSITNHNYYKALLALFYLSVLQLPIIIIQRLTYSYFPEKVKLIIGIHDFSTGTFFVSGDVGLGFLSLLWIIFFLFDKNNKIISYRANFWIVWFIATILFINSKLIILLMAISFSVYLIKNKNAKKVLQIIFIITPIFFVANLILKQSFSKANVDKSIIDRIITIRREITVANSESITNWMQGYKNKKLENLTRGTVVNYLIHVNDSKWIGHGPNSSSTKFGVPLGDFTDIYYELGLVGLFFVVWMKIRVVFDSVNKFNKFYWLALTSFILLSFTVRTLQAPSIFLVILMFSNTWRLNYAKD